MKEGGNQSAAEGSIESESMNASRCDQGWMQPTWSASSRRTDVIGEPGFPMVSWEFCTPLKEFESLRSAEPCPFGGVVRWMMEAPTCPT